MAQRLHTFTAPTYSEAYRQMREALGSQAVVLRTTHVREKGILGLLGRKSVHLTAAAASNRASESAARNRSPVEKKYTVTERPRMDEKVRDKMAYFERIVSDAQKRMAAARLPSDGNAAVLPFRKPAASSVSQDELRRELYEMRQMLQVLYAEHPSGGLPIELAPHYRMLVERGVSRKAAACLVGAVIEGSDLRILREPRAFVERLRMEIQKSVPVTGGIGLAGGVCRRVALVGTTGVGKTTNLAKLAAEYAVRQRARVALLTTDTYRVAAPEQLRVYANIIGLPLTVVNDAKEAATAVQANRDKDLLLIDTAGGSQFNAKQIHELRETFATLAPNEVMLVVSANTQLDDLRQAVEKFGCLCPTSLFFTKLDETKRYGPVFTLAVETGLPLSYLSMGQNVPDDLMLAQPGMVANLILEGK